MKSILLLFLIFTSTLTFAQDPNIIWQKTIGGSSSDYLTNILHTLDGGLLIGGNSTSNISGDKTEDSQGENDIWIVKLNSEGEIEWQNTIGGSEDDYLNDIIILDDGGYLLASTSSSNISGDKTENSQGGKDYWVIKINDSGEIEWQNTIGADEDDFINEIIQTNDGGFVLAGTSDSGISGDRTVFNNGYSDFWFVKITENGILSWQYAFGYGNNDSLTCLIPTNDGSLMAGGIIDAGGIGNYYYGILKISNTGNYLGDRLYGGSHDDRLINILQTQDGGFILLGFSDSDISGDKTEDSMGSYDYWVIKINSNYEIEWQNTIGGNNGDASNSIIESPEGGYFMSGYSYSNASGDKTEDNNGGESTDYWVIKINDVGIIEWQNSIGGFGPERIPYAIQNSDGSYMIAGTSGSDISGDKTENSRGGFDYWIVKHAQTLGISENEFSDKITIYPNPVKSELKINSTNLNIDLINIYSLTGQLLMSEKVNSDSSNFDVSNLATGEYFIQFYAGKKIALKKFIKH